MGTLFFVKGRYEMKMKIFERRKFRGYARELLKIESTVNMGESGYHSVKEMQRELLMRFPNRTNVLNRRIRNGIIRIEGSRLDHYTQVITLEN